MSDDFNHLTVTDATPWQPENTSALSMAIARMERELPGWWWRVGSCHVSSDASIGPCSVGPDALLLRTDLFDQGFHADVPHPSTCAEALNRCIDTALVEKIKHKNRAPADVEEDVKKMVNRAVMEERERFVSIIQKNVLSSTISTMIVQDIFNEKIL